MRASLLLLLITALLSVQAVEPDTPLDLRISKDPLATLVERLARQLDVGIHVTGDVVDELDSTVTIDVREVAWRKVQQFFTAEYDLSLTVRDGYLVVETADAALRRQLVTRMYVVEHLFTGITQLPGTNLGLPEPGGSGAELVPEIEDDDATEIGDLIELIEAVTGYDQWEVASTAIEEIEDRLVITHVPAVHAEIDRLLDQVERSAARQVVARLWVLPEQELGVGQTVLTADEWQNLHARPVNPAICFLLQDGQRNHDHAGQHQALLADWDVVGEALDPIVSKVVSGLMIDAISQVTKGGIVTDVRLELGHLAAVTPSKATVGDTAVQTDLPKYQHQRIADTRLVPPGGAAIYRLAGRTLALSLTVHDFAE